MSILINVLENHKKRVLELWLTAFLPEKHLWFVMLSVWKWSNSASKRPIWLHFAEESDKTRWEQMCLANVSLHNSINFNIAAVINKSSSRNASTQGVQFWTSVVSVQVFKSRTISHLHFRGKVTSPRPQQVSGTCRNLSTWARKSTLFFQQVAEERESGWERRRKDMRTGRDYSVLKLRKFRFLSLYLSFHHQPSTPQ